MNNKTKTIVMTLAAICVAYGSTADVFAEKMNYNMDEINTAFEFVGDNYFIDHEGILHIDWLTILTQEDRPTSYDVGVIKMYTEGVHNRLVISDVFYEGDELDAIYDEIKDGPFRALYEFDLFESAATSTNAGHSDVTGEYSAFFMCGIDVSTIAVPKLTINLNGETTKTIAKTKLLNEGWHQVPLLYTYMYLDDYAKVNTEGYGTCDDGAFRDQNIVYDARSSPRLVDGVVAKGIYTLQQLNEPNPELSTYWHPDWNWRGFVQMWHKYH